MEKWQYRVLFHASPLELEKTLNVLGDTGWELTHVSYDGTNHVLFLRKRA